MGLFDAIVGTWTTAKDQSLQRETNALNYRMWQEGWQRETEYNKPVNQVARLKEAGLNPALMYGTGSGSNTIDGGPAPSFDSPRQGQLPSSGLDPGAVVAIQQARLVGEQRELVKEQARGLRLENNVIENSPGSLKKDSAVTRGARELLHSGPVKSLGVGMGTAAAGMKERGVGGTLKDAARFWSDLLIPKWMKEAAAKSNDPEYRPGGSKFWKP